MRDDDAPEAAASDNQQQSDLVRAMREVSAMSDTQLFPAPSPGTGARVASVYNANQVMEQVALDQSVHEPKRSTQSSLSLLIARNERDAASVEAEMVARHEECTAAMARIRTDYELDQARLRKRLESIRASNAALEAARAQLDT